MSNTPLTDEIIKYCDYQFPATQGHIPLRTMIENIEKENAELKKELGMLRELVGVRADASACVEDAQHWLKLMKAWDNNIKLRSVLLEVDEVLTELDWHSDRGLLVRIRRVLESTKNESQNGE